MELRDKFALEVMKIIFVPKGLTCEVGSDKHFEIEEDNEALARGCYLMADTMMKVREE